MSLQTLAFVILILNCGLALRASHLLFCQLNDSPHDERLSRLTFMRVFTVCFLLPMIAGSFAYAAIAFDKSPFSGMIQGCMVYSVTLIWLGSRWRFPKVLADTRIKGDA